METYCHRRNSETASSPGTVKLPRSYIRTAMDVEKIQFGPPFDLQDRWTINYTKLTMSLGMSQPHYVNKRTYPYLPNAVQLELPIQKNADSTTENYTQDRGHIGIRGFWAKQFNCIVDIRITYPESNSNRNSTVEKLLEKQEKEKKKKYLQPCLERRRHFTPFIATTD